MSNYIIRSLKKSPKTRIVVIQYPTSSGQVIFWANKDESGLMRSTYAIFNDEEVSNVVAAILARGYCSEPSISFTNCEVACMHWGVTDSYARMAPFLGFISDEDDGWPFAKTSNPFSGTPKTEELRSTCYYCQTPVSTSQFFSYSDDKYEISLACAKCKRADKIKLTEAQIKTCNEQGSYQAFLGK
jgi:hypothetical protein